MQDPYYDLEEELKSCLANCVELAEGPITAWLRQRLKEEGSNSDVTTTAVPIPSSSPRNGRVDRSIIEQKAHELQVELTEADDQIDMLHEMAEQLEAEKQQAEEASGVNDDHRSSGPSTSTSSVSGGGTGGMSAAERERRLQFFATCQNRALELHQVLIHLNDLTQRLKQDPATSIGSSGSGNSNDPPTNQLVIRILAGHPVVASPAAAAASRFNNNNNNNNDNNTAHNTNTNTTNANAATAAAANRYATDDVAADDDRTYNSNASERLSNEEFMRVHMAQQNDDSVAQEAILDRLGAGLGRLRTHATDIHEEVQMHDTILGRLSHQIETTQANVAATTERVNRLLEQMSNKSRVMLVVFLIVMVVVLGGIVV